MKKAVLFFFVLLSFLAVDTRNAAAESGLLPGLYRIRSGDCPVLDLRSFYCRDGGKVRVRFTAETCYMRPRPTAVWYDGVSFYFIWLKDYKTESPDAKEWRGLVPSIYWIAQNNCPNLTLKNVCNNNVARNFRPSTKCYTGANAFYWNGRSYRFGWANIKRGIGQVIAK